MPIVVPRRGTRGSKLPMPRGRLGALVTSFMTVFMRRGGRIQGRPLLELTTVGRRSGRARTTVLGWFEDPSDPAARLIVASFGGSVEHPDWFLNLAAHPESVEALDGDFRVPPSVASP